jgi:L-ascorbate metabolism protein UlaG (beta-lactamase superfamily)
MQIKWFGQSAFILTSDAGTRILIDPYDRFLGYKMPKPIEVDMVAVTHAHGDHNKIQVASGNYMLVNEPKEYSHEGFSVKGIKTFHDKVKGKKRGDNIIFRFDVEGLRVCHCGDLGHILTEEQVNAIGPPRGRVTSPLSTSLTISRLAVSRDKKEVSGIINAQTSRHKKQLFN